MSGNTYKLTEFLISNLFTLELIVKYGIGTTELCLAEAKTMSVAFLYYRIQFIGAHV
jgi:hypothetical protein